MSVDSPLPVRPNGKDARSATTARSGTCNKRKGAKLLQWDEVSLSKAIEA